MKIIVNASPLIFLAKLKKLHILTDLSEEVFTTEEVASEVLIEKYLDARDIKTYLEGGKIKILKTKRTTEIEHRLGRGEVSVIRLALENKVKNVILDDYVAIKIAKYYGLVPMSTPYLLLLGLKKKKIEPEEFKKCLEKLVRDFEYRISGALYMKIIEAARE